MIRLDYKKPSEVRRVTHDWTPFLGTATIASQTTVGSGVTVNSSVLSNGNRSVDFVFSAGSYGVAIITQTITSSAGDVETETFQIVIQDDEPVSLEDAIDQVRGIKDDEVDLLSGYIRSARQSVESESGWILVRRSFTEHFRRWNNYVELGRRPIITVDAVTYHDENGDVQPYVGFFPVLDLAPARVYPIPGQSFPVLGQGGLASFTYTAGLAEGDASAPSDLGRQAILLLAAHWYASREPISDRPVNEIPYSVAALIDRFRVPVA